MGQRNSQWAQLEFLILCDSYDECAGAPAPLSGAGPAVAQQWANQEPAEGQPRARSTESADCLAHLHEQAACWCGPLFRARAHYLARVPNLARAAPLTLLFAKSTLKRRPPLIVSIRLQFSSTSWRRRAWKYRVSSPKGEEKSATVSREFKMDCFVGLSCCRAVELSSCWAVELLSWRTGELVELANW